MRPNLDKINSSKFSDPKISRSNTKTTLNETPENFYATDLSAFK